MLTPAKYNLRKIATPAIALLFFSFAVFLLHRLLNQYHYNDIKNAFYAIPTIDIFSCLFFTASSYFFLTLYDTLAFLYIDKPLAYPRVALTSFISYTFANNTGSLSILTSSSIRYRFYSGWGFSGIEIARIIWFCMASFWLGYLFLTGMSFLVTPPAHIIAIKITQTAILRVIGVFFLLLIGVYLTITLTRKGSVRILKWDLKFPPPQLAVGQIAVAVLDLLSVATALYVLLPEMNLPFYSFISLFLLAMMLGLLSNVPGGLGVFESIMLLMLTPYAEPSRVISALLLFRSIYYLLPLVVALTAIGGLGVYSHKATVVKISSTIEKTISLMIPQVFALAAMVSGGILLFSSAMPRLNERISWLIKILPLSILEFSHFLGSITGMGLLIIASGLRRRLDMAYFLSIILLMIGIVSTLLKGLDYEEAAWLSILLLVFSVNHNQFYRRSSILAEPVKLTWLGTVLIILFGSIGLGLFIYRHQSYSHELWWQFTIHGDASRFMRASVGVTVFVCIFAFSKLFKAYQPIPSVPHQEELLLAAAIAAKAPNTQGYLALLGDKALLFSESRKTFIMFGIRGRSWIVMGDPIGDEQEKADLVWKFKDTAEYFTGWPVFYEVGPENISWYLDMGMTVLKIGEEGRVRLPEFTLVGSKHKSLRYIHNRLTKEGYQFEIVPPDKVPLIMPELKAVSDQWLLAKHVGEKGFSLGFFDDHYLSNFPVAVVYFQNKILAFANLWPGGEKKELSIDLMRHSNDAPHGIMDFIFCEIMNWGKNQKYEWFSLGMVPLAGLEPEKVRSLWSNVGTFVYRHGEHFYNFEGLRRYKEKFEPVWQPKYLILPGILKLPAVFADLTALIGGSLKKVLAR